ncbi:MAG: hypothetical protein ACK5NG_04035 [Chthoniobacterales bacterium]
MRAQNAAPGHTSLNKSIISDTSQRISETPTVIDNGWSFTLEPYLWGIGLSGDIGVKGIRPIDVDFSPKSVLHHLDWGLMARGEVRKGRWGLLGDGLFAKLSADGNPPAPLYRDASLKVYQGMASLAVAYRIVDRPQGFLDVYAGARFNYMQFNFGGDLDSAGIQRVSNAAVERIGGVIDKRVEAYLLANSTAITAEIQKKVASLATEKLMTAAVSHQGAIQDSLSADQLYQIVSKLQKNDAAYREFLAATAEAKAAQSKNQLTPAMQQRLANAKKKLAKALAKKIEQELPTSARGDQWWVDPILGLCGQINFTRWLFLAAQGDVGGFGAASDIAWMAQASIGVNFTRHIFGEVGYRYFYMDYKNDGFIYKASQSGVFMGVGVRF